VEFFDRSTMGMVPLRLERGAVFSLILTRKRSRLRLFLKITPASARIPIRRAAARGAPRLRDRMQLKVYVDNYLEGYHIPIAHPGLMREIVTAIRTETFRTIRRQFAPIRR